uniref:BZIP domain-containing protein n=1 Tax=Steinernema glaseri TaxID=37863 RepID=A0A1I7ZWB4_9BILA
MSPKAVRSDSPPSSSSAEYEPQKKRGRPRMDDSEVIQDAATSDEMKSKIIYRRKYAREYRERIRADLQTKEEMREALQRVEAENRFLKATLEQLKQENFSMISNMLQAIQRQSPSLPVSASSPPVPVSTSAFLPYMPKR